MSGAMENKKAAIPREANVRKTRLMGFTSCFESDLEILPSTR